MRRVRFIYWSKRIYHSVTLKIFLLGMSVSGVALYVSLPNIFYNMRSIADAASVWKFFSVAFLNTRSSVQLITLVSLAILVWLARDIVRNIQETREFQRQSI